MNSPDVVDLTHSAEFELLTELGHTDLAPFVAEYYWRRKSWVTLLHYAFSAAVLGTWIFVGLQERYSVDEWLSRFGAAVLAFIVLVPIHEFIHGAVYRANGAKDVRFSGSLRQFYAYAVAHNFVADRVVFAWVALAPFVIITAALALAAALIEPLRFLLLGALLLHTAGTSGDFAMLNYLWMNRRREVYTFDDAAERKSYFYAQIAPRE